MLSKLLVTASRYCTSSVYTIIPNCFCVDFSFNNDAPFSNTRVGLAPPPCHASCYPWFDAALSGPATDCNRECIMLRRVSLPFMAVSADPGENMATYSTKRVDQSTSEQAQRNSTTTVPCRFPALERKMRIGVHVRSYCNA